MIAWNSHRATLQPCAVQFHMRHAQHGHGHGHGHGHVYVAAAARLSVTASNGDGRSRMVAESGEAPALCTKHLIGIQRSHVPVSAAAQRAANLAAFFVSSLDKPLYYLMNVLRALAARASTPSAHHHHMLDHMCAFLAFYRPTNTLGHFGPHLTSGTPPRHP